MESASPFNTYALLRKVLGPFLIFKKCFVFILEVWRKVLRPPGFEWAPQGGGKLACDSSLNRFVAGGNPLDPSHRQLRYRKNMH